jgi:hypothetical protein
LGFPGGAINVKALAAATEQMTAPIAAATPKAESNAGPDDAITGPIRAVATNPPVRATALFSPDAAPVWWLSTDINTAVVSGATAPAIPKAIMTIAGNAPSQKLVSDPIRTARRKPAATMTGPVINSHRGPTLAANAPAAGDAKAITSGRGSSAALNQTGQQITRRNLNIQPTLTIRPGFPVRVIVNRDLLLEPYRG